MSAASERRYLVWICHGCDECSKPYAERTTPCDGASMSGAWVKLAQRPSWMSEEEWQGPELQVWRVHYGSPTGFSSEFQAATAEEAAEKWASQIADGGTTEGTILHVAGEDFPLRRRAGQDGSRWTVMPLLAVPAPTQTPESAHQGGTDV